MLEKEKEAPKEPKNTPKEIETVSEVKTKDYTVLKTVTLKEVHNVGSTVSVEVGSDLEKYLLTNKFVNKHGISRSNK